MTNVHHDEAKRALIEMLGELAARLDAWVLANFVGVVTLERIVGALADRSESDRDSTGTRAHPAQRFIEPRSS